MENLRGIMLMTAGMAGFALSDMFIKSASASVSIGQIVVSLGLGGALIFGALAALRGARLWSRDLISGPVLLRNGAEMVGTLGFVTALALTPLSSASAILQATPLAVTLGAALFLGERVGWRRWSAIGVGFLGVLIILRPGLAGFQPASLFAVQGVIGLSVRDLATRRCPASISTLQLSAWGFAMIVPAGALLLLIGPPPQPVAAAAALNIAGAVLIGVVAYYALTASMRLGDVSAVTPFRYSRLVFALIIGVLVFGERPDGATLLGATIVIGSGLYAILRERRLVTANTPG